MTNSELKQALIIWAKRHPDVFQGGQSSAPWWWLQNFLGSVKLLPFEDLYDIMMEQLKHKEDETRN